MQADLVAMLPSVMDAMADYKVKSIRKTFGRSVSKRVTNALAVMRMPVLVSMKGTTAKIINAVKKGRPGDDDSSSDSSDSSSRTRPPKRKAKKK